MLSSFTKKGEIERASTTPGLLVTNDHIIRVLMVSLVSLFTGCSQVILKRKEKKQKHVTPEFPVWVRKYPVAQIFSKDLKKLLAEGLQGSTGYSAGNIRPDRKYPVRPRIYSDISGRHKNG